MLLNGNHRARSSQILVSMVSVFFVATGRDFRHAILSHLRFKASNNLLEFRAEVVATWVVIVEGEASSSSIVLSVTNNTSAVGYAQKSSLSDCTYEPRIAVSRKLASLVMDHDFFTHSQHFAGWTNVVADCLSRYFHLDDNFLIHLLTFFSLLSFQLLFKSTLFLKKLCVLSLESWKSCSCLHKDAATAQNHDLSWTRWCTFTEEFTFGGDPVMDQI